MIYTFDNEKYIHGERKENCVSLRIEKTQKMYIKKNSVFHSDLTANNKMFSIVSGSIKINGKIAEEGCVIYISKFTKFKLTPLKGADIIETAFDSTGDIPFLNAPIKIIKASPEIQEYFNRMYINTFFCNNLPGVNEGLFLNILNMLNLLNGSYSAELNLYQRCYRWIDSHSTLNITAETAADAMNCTTAHLNRVIKKHSGKCLSSVIAERKISKIKQMIRHTNSETKEIAQRMDFGTPELLRKYFKYHTGISLKEYRRREQGYDIR